MIVQKASGRLNHPDVAQILNTIGWIMSGSARLDDAADHFEHALEICRVNKMGAEHVVVRRLSASEGINNARIALSAARTDEAQVRSQKRKFYKCVKIVE